MGRLLGIFARKVEGAGFLSAPVDEGLEGGAFIERGGRLDAGLFGDLGGKSTDIKEIFADIDGRLGQVTALTSDIADLRQNFGHFLKLYRDLALLNVSLGREKERLEGELLTMTQHCSRAEDELGQVRLTSDDNGVKLEKAMASIESYEQNVQILGVARRELEGKLHEVQTALAAVTDEESVLRREAEAFKIRISGDEERIRDLAEKYQVSAEQATSLREQCQALEGDLRLRGENISVLKEENVRLAHETDRLTKDNANLEKLVNDSRAETSATFDRYQKEVRVREEQLGDLKQQLKALRTEEQMLQKVGMDLKAENERLVRELRDSLEVNRQNEVQITRCDTKIARLTADGEAALIARNQLDQARLAMVSRVEALTQALRAGEVDIKRLENEVAMLAQKNHDLESSYVASMEQRGLRIHELEGQLEHQKNENAYLTSKFAERGDL